MLSKVVLSVPKMGKEQPDKKSRLFAGAMRKTARFVSLARRGLVAQ